jgi:ferritin
MNKKTEDMMNEQINKELYSAYLYYAMSAYFEDQNLKGMAQWMRVQAGEEVEHAQKFYDHIVRRGGSVKLKAIAAPEIRFQNPLAAWDAAYKHEQMITASINSILEAATAEKDHAAVPMLHWFVDEQIEEEEQTLDVVNKLKAIKDSAHGLLMVDRELGARKGD